MALHTRLHRRSKSGIYYCRASVPSSLRPAIGKREIWLSLATSDPREAQERIKPTSMEVDRLFSQTRGSKDSLDLPSSTWATPSLIEGSILSQRDNLTFSQLVERFTNLPEKQSLGNKTKLEYRITFRLLAELLGENTPIHRITRADCRRVQEALTLLPPNSAKRFPGMPLLKVIEHARRERLSPMNPKTANNLLTRLSAILGWAHREGLTTHNPASGLSLPENEHARDKRHPFTVEQLNLIFNSCHYTDKSAARDGWFWIPLLALFTGARLGELCQLHTSDVILSGGIHCLLISGGDGKHIKTRNSRRTIPLHPELERLGFARYAAEKRLQGESLLFPELPGHKHGRASDQFSKRFGYFLHEVGAKTDRTCFHSFRHTFRDALREAGVQKEVVQVLGGWARGGGTEEIYGAGFSTKILFDAIKRIQYFELNIEHMSPYVSPFALLLPVSHVACD